MSDLDALAADLNKAAAGVQREAPVVVGAEAARLVQIARQHAPRSTGTLANSIGATPGLGGLTAEVGPTVDYAPFVEYGTSRMGPQPFMGPAADQIESDFTEAMEALGGDVL